jgi:hypothetical protein
MAVSEDTSEDELEQRASNPRTNHERAIYGAARRVAADIRALRQQRDDAVQQSETIKAELERLNDIAIGNPIPQADAVSGEHGKGLCVPMLVARRGMNPGIHLLLAIVLGVLYVFVLPRFIPGAESIQIFKVLPFAALFLVLAAGLTLIISLGRGRGNRGGTDG